ncbi:MAG TPA: NAD(P)-binding domain-containing protein, partial [Actinoallomurus sp.]
MGSEIGVTGLAVMGQNLARNIARHGFQVAVHNRSESRTKQLIERYGDEGEFTPATTIEEFVAALDRPRRVVIMVKAGGPVDAVIDELVPLLDKGDILIDGGNSHFEDTRRREAALAERGLHFLGTGVSGGEEGALLGPSIMPGGPGDAYEPVAPILTTIAARVDGTPCCAHIGPDGAGH